MLVNDLLIEERARIVKGEREPEIYVSADSNDRIVENCQRVYRDIKTINAHHAMSMPERWREEYIKYMTLMHTYLEKELAKLGEIRYIESGGD